MARVLVVDDSASTRAYVRAILKGADYEVDDAASGFEAMRLLPKGRYDLLVFDVNMPEINGLELIAFVRKNAQYKDTPVLVISTQAKNVDASRALALGANGFLAKPFAPDALLAHVAEAIASAPAAPPLQSLGEIRE